MKIIAKSRNGKMLKIGTDEKSAKWYFLSDKVVEFVKTGINKGDEVEIETTKKNGKYTVNFIKKASATTSQPQEPSNDVPTCEDCGKELKDAKYKKCYTCNQNSKEEKTKDGVKLCACGNEIKGDYKQCYICNQKAKEKGTTAQYTCDVCGAPMKSDKYPTCYNCAQVQKNETTKPTCNKCGKELKNDNYDLCYTCFQEEQKNPSPATTSKQESIKRQAIGHMASRSLISLQGHITPNNIEEIATRLYKKFQELVE